MAKPGKFDTLKKDKLIEEIESGTTIKGACGIVGVHPSTFYYHYGDDEKFTTRVDIAKRKADAMVEKSLYQTAREGNVPAIKYWLTNRNPEDWGESAGADFQRALEQYSEALLENARN